MLTQEQIDFYHTQGYLGLNNILSTEEVAELQRVTDEFVDASRAVTQHTDVFDLEPGHTPENPRLRRLKNPIEQHPVYHNLIRHKHILDIVSQLIGDTLFTNGNKLNLKSAGFGSAVEWHHDFAFYPHTNDDLLAVGIAIDDMALENGPLMVIPGSHKDRIYSHHQDGIFVGAVTDANFDMAAAVPIELTAGGISIHHARILHASAPNVSNRPRRLLLYQYCAGDAWPLLGVSNWQRHQAAFLRGEATQTPRLAEIPVQIPLPTGDREGSIYEVQTMLKQRVMAQASQ